MRIETESQTEGIVENMMETIVFPETHQRWVNLIPLPPRTTSRSKNRPESSSRREGSRGKSK